MISKKATTAPATNTKEAKPQGPPHRSRTAMEETAGQLHRKELEEEIIEKMKQRELRKELESLLQQSLFNIDNIKSIQSCWDSIAGFHVT